MVSNGLFSLIHCVMVLAEVVTNHHLDYFPYCLNRVHYLIVNSFVSGFGNLPCNALQCENEAYLQSSIMILSCW